VQRSALNGGSPHNPTPRGKVVGVSEGVGPTTISSMPSLFAAISAIVASGERNIELYRLMIASRLTPQAKPGSDLDEAAGQAFGLVRMAMSKSWERQITEDEVYLAWAQLHGLVMLKADGFIKSALFHFIEKTGFRDG